MNYLGLDDVLAIACEVLGLEVNALLHVTDVGLADSAVARPQAGFAGQEFHPTLEAKAASLLLGLARNHAFIDGNKRIAVLATLQFLNANDHDLDLLPVEAVYQAVVQVASGDLALDDLTDWIRGRLKPLSRAVAGIVLGPTVAFSLTSDDMYEGWIVECATCGTTETVMEPDDWDAAAERLKSQMAEHVRLGHPDYELVFAEVVDGTGSCSDLGMCLESGPASEVLAEPAMHGHAWQLTEAVWRCVHCGLEAR